AHSVSEIRRQRIGKDPVVGGTTALSRLAGDVADAVLPADRWEVGAGVGNHAGADGSQAKRDGTIPFARRDGVPFATVRDFSTVDQRQSGLGVQRDCEQLDLAERRRYHSGVLI